MCQLLESDDVNVINEAEIFEAMLLWIKYDLTRKSWLPKLFARIRLKHMSKEVS